MVDHLAISVSNLEASGAFYDGALLAIGYSRLMQEPKEFAGCLTLGWEDSNKADLYISEGQVTEPPMHIAFRVDQREQVDRFFKAAVESGGTDKGMPGLRPSYHKNYYAAYVLDPDGHNIEAVCH